MNKKLRIKKKKEIIKNRKLEKLKSQQNEYTFDKVFTLQHFVKVYPKCLLGVRWKASVQRYITNSVSKLYNDFLLTKERKLPKPVSDKEVTIYERGKPRTITPIHVKDRVTQKVLCDFALVPILSKKLIYDNGASLKGKGVMFSRNRALKHLYSAVREYGTDFYVLSFDFKNFFDSVPHKTCREILERYIYDKEIIDITMDVIKSPHRTRINKIKDKNEKIRMIKMLDNDELYGICLGSQVSQIMALIIANDIDHYIKDVKKCRYYVRYMDDGIVFLKTKNELIQLHKELKNICDRLGLRLNDNKTHITKIRKGFTFLKVRYCVTDNGKIVKKLTRKGIVRMRRKLKKFKRKVDNGEMTLDNVYDSIQSWIAHSKIANSYKTYKSMMKLYNSEYNGYRITKKWNNIGGKNSELLQTDKWSKYRWGCIA
ncbi:MAG: RNA-directed DNA polymerase [Bacteroidaceae bacterium]|nr:RNA-directed DNA polymerase [Bacteroidaceae bacterium]